MSPFWIELLSDITATLTLFFLVVGLIMFWRGPKCPR